MVAAVVLAAARGTSLRLAATVPRGVASVYTAADVDPYKDKSKYVLSREDAPYALGKHRSNALELIEKQPIIEVEGDIAICDGGGGALGHPLEYIKVGHLNGKWEACKYCGLKYRKKQA